ncbi:MAG: hypothetical protein HQ481_02985 [Alphaproteobacteria bacterium]|nr:hypothetical protein [Alphaproteobacteria bacterium]
MNPPPTDQLLTLTDEEIQRLDVLFLAKYPPKPGAPPPPEVDPVIGRERLTKWEVFNALQSLGLTLSTVETLEEFKRYTGSANYVFCLFNREDIRNPETVVASLCAQRRLPHLGAPPNLRAMAEDKFLTKSVAAYAGLPVAPGVTYVDLDDLAVPPPFEGPYFAKPRFGANSEGITAEAAQPDWSRLKPVVGKLIEDGEEVLVEPLLAGRDITVTVLGGRPNFALTPTVFKSELPYGIATEGQKRLLEGGRSGGPLEDSELSKTVMNLALEFAAYCKPFDYMRVDFRQTLTDRRLSLLEFNLTSNLGTHGATGIAIRNDRISHVDLIQHLVAYSTRRQKVLLPQT